MKAIIIEDEKLSAEHLENLLLRIDAEIEIIGKYDSVKKSIEVLKKGTNADLIFLDIHLADGISFDIFKEISIEIPIIFTTAYNEYAIKAFELNSIDYLLKPIGREELSKSLDKFHRLENIKQNFDKILPLLNQSFSNQINQSNPTNYKSRFLVKLGENINSIQSAEINHFVSEDGMVLLVNSKGKRFPVDFNLDQLEEILNPSDFFRINRKVILNINSIEKMATYFNSRLKVHTLFLDEESSIVSRDRVSEFKKMLDN